MKAGYQIGYFGVPGRDGGKTHLVESGKPVCHTPLPKASEFQWCSHGIHSYVVECQRCLPVQRRLQEEDLRQRIDELAKQINRFEIKLRKHIGV